MKIKAIINTGEGFWQGYLHCDLLSGDSAKHARIRLFNPISKPDSFNNYVLYTTVPSFFKNARIRVYLTRDEGNLVGTVSGVNVELLSR